MSVLTFNQSGQDKEFKNICTLDKSNNISSKKELLMESLIQFYAIKKYLDRIKDIISGNDTKNKYKISLRICDWFVTNYSKKYNISYPIVLNNKNKNFIVYLDYKSQLKAYSKKQFDPFCRRERISFMYHENYDVIENDMNNSLRNLYKKKDGETNRRKRTELSISATKTVNKHDVSITVQFD